MRGLLLRAAPVAALTALAGCGGGDDDYANEPRPATPIVVSAAIVGDEVSVSPKRFGAGLVNFVVTNQTGEARRLRVETDEIGGTQAGMRAQSPEIPPRGTGTLKADLRQGTYRLSIEGGGDERSERLDVGAPRPSAQNELLLP
jgi:hypothetical protein